MTPLSPAPGFHRAAVTARPHRRQKPADGFALIITITLLAFLVLLLVSLASLTRVETQVASNGQQMSKARQNALLALNIALGQLQKTVGPDQRVTATADIAGDRLGARLTTGAPATNTHGAAAPDGSRAAVANGLAGAGPGTRYWTGAWGNFDPPSAIYQQTPAPVLLNWLVSGNENASAFTTDPSTGRITSPSVTASFRPEMIINNLDTGTTALSTNLSVNSHPAVLLIGPNTTAADTASPTTADLERYVVAPLQEIQVSSETIPGLSGSTPATIGRYAWWVGDEGVKARYNIVDPYQDKTDPVTQPEARRRLLTPAHTGVELLANLDNYPAPAASSAASAAAHSKLSDVFTLKQARLLSPTIAQNELNTRYHDLTAVSESLLTDTLNGGLRQDLTYQFEQSTLGSPFAGNNIIPTTASPTTGPTWDQLYSFYNTPTAGTGTSTSIVCRPQTSTQMGITPLIAQVRIFVSKNPDPGATVLPPAGMKLRCNVVFVLANPYDTTLRSPAGGVDFMIWNPYTISQGNIILSAARVSGTKPDGSFNYATDTFGIVRSPLLATNADPNHGLVDMVKFHIDSFSIPPGQSIVLSVDGNTQKIDVTGPVPTSTSLPSLQINLREGLPSSSVYSDSFYEAIQPFILTKSTGNPALPPNPSSRPDRLGLVPNGNIWPYLTVQMRAASSGDILQEIARERSLVTTRTPGWRIYSETNTYIGAMVYQFAGPANRFNDKDIVAPNNTVGLDGRAYQDYNLRGASLDFPNVARARVNTADSTSLTFYTHPLYLGTFTAGLISPAAFNVDLLPVSAGNGPYWAENFTSTSSRSSITAIGILFSLPRRDDTSSPPLLSIGQLQHTSLTADDQHSGIYFQPGYAVGNSYSHPLVARSNAVQSRANNFFIANDSGGYTGTTDPVPTRYFDISYLLNAALWDKYFFSSIPQTGSSLVPLNPRYHPVDPQVTTAQLRQAGAARYLLVNGGFNINSTSKDAWMAVLGGLNKRATINDNTDGAVFARGLWQPGNSTDATTGTGNDAYTGVRRLNQTQLGNLADEIVRRVRARGPFVSLAQFINRTLVEASTDYNPVINDATATGSLATGNTVPMGRGLSGPLQASIDAAGRNPTATTPSGGLNDFTTVNTNGAGANGDRILINKITGFSTMTTPAATPYFADENKETTVYPNSNYTATGAPGPQGRKSTAIPGWLLQGDILQSLGSVLTARSDTFVVRTYGEVINPLDPSGVPLGRAWCEAVVQRLPDYVLKNDNAAEAAPADLTNTNRTFGRGFKVISLRWLTPADI